MTKQSYLLLPECFDFFVVFVEFLFEFGDFHLQFFFSVFAAVRQATLTELKHRLDVIRPVEDRAVQLDVFDCRRKNILTNIHTPTM